LKTSGNISVETHEQERIAKEIQIKLQQMQNSSHLTKSSLKLMEPTQKLRQAPTCVYNATTAAITTTLRQKSLSASQWRLPLDVQNGTFVRGMLHGEDLALWACDDVSHQVP